MNSDYLIFLAVGRLLVFVATKFYKDNEINIKFLNKLLSCSLCSGVWIFTFLSAVTGITVFEDALPYIPLLSWVFTGCVSSYIVFIFEHGWRAYHETIVVR